MLLLFPTMMRKAQAVHLLIICATILIETGVAQYTWNCSEPGERGERFIPGIARDYPTNVLTSTTARGVVHLYRVQTLNAECYGEVTAINFCYQYSTTGQGEAVFNWTVLMFEETDIFTVTKIYVLESRPSSLSEGGCQDSIGGKSECCDRKIIESFELQNSFIFGVAESAQGNTAGATLLGFLDDGAFNVQPEYVVFTIQISIAGQTLSVGSTLSRPGGGLQRGLRMLWFVSGSPIANTSTSQATTPASLDDIPDVVGGVVGSLLLITVIVLMMFICVSLLLAKRSQKKSQHKVDSNGSVSLLSSNINKLATDRDSNRSIKYATTSLDKAPANENERFNTAAYDNVQEEIKVPEEYILPISTKGHRTRPTAGSPTEGNKEQVYATAYEVPMTQTSKSVDDENPYMIPATNERALYHQLSLIRIDHFARDSITLTKPLGVGEFGKVHQGDWVASEGGEKIEVAIKTLREGAGEQDKIKFLQEAATMGQFSHPNVVQLYGVVTEGEPIMLIIELLPKGDLRELLCSIRSQSKYELETDAKLPYTLLSYCRQVASGMGYLAAKAFVHRDLAARNILVSEDDVCKIADFGMSRDLEETKYYISQGGAIPVKWTAPEALHYKKYSTASDVWSFGCVMYEIWSLGCKPFEYISHLTCVQLINKGIRLAPPPGCPKKVYKLMMNCWHPDPSNRPDFESVLQQLSLPDTKLLKWSEEDKATDPEAATLGARLDKAANLYKRLQERYM